MTDDETPEEPIKFSMIEAAKRIGVSKSTMHRYIERGRVSVTKLPDGQGYEIRADELFRAFPDAWKNRPGTVSETPDRDAAEPAGTVPETPNENMALRAEVKMLREMLARADLDSERQRREAADAIDDYRARLDREAEERRALNARLLTYQQPPAPPAGLERPCQARLPRPVPQGQLTRLKGSAAS